jgi:hypothetical protein
LVLRWIIVRCIRNMRCKTSVNAVHQECWKPPVHTGLSLPQGSKTSKEEGECSMPGKGTQG